MMSEQTAADKKTSKGSRKARVMAARLSATQAVYQMMGNDQSASDVVKEFIDFRLGQSFEGEELVTSDEALFQKIVEDTEKKRSDIDLAVSEALHDRDRGAKGERSTSLEPLLLSILLCGACELMIHREVDAPVIISDYLNVTHAFYDQGESKLVNAILDQIRKKTEGAIEEKEKPDD